ERERDHREIGAALARAPKDDDADQISEQAGDDGGQRQRQNGDDRGVLKDDKGKTGEVGREAKEQRLAERQKTRLPPAQTDTDGGGRVKRVKAELISPELPEQKRQRDGDEDDDTSCAQRSLAASAKEIGSPTPARRNSHWPRWSRRKSRCRRRRSPSRPRASRRRCRARRRSAQRMRAARSRDP